MPNDLYTLHQPIASISSLKMVSANTAKELQNVFPKCNPFHLEIRYDVDETECTGLPLANLFTPTHLNIQMTHRHRRHN